VSTKALVDANPGVTPTALRIGQKIQVPPPSATSASATSAPAVAENGSQIYTVKSGDTLSKIATRFSVTVKAIRSANNLRTDSIKVGQKLKIPAMASAPAPAPAIPETVPPAPAGTAP
jgi:LysM repeat protein